MLISLRISWVWVVGEHGLILHYDGQLGIRMYSGTMDRLTAVWGSGRSEVWAIGDRGTRLHFDGSTWHVVSGRHSPLQALHR